MFLSKLKILTLFVVAVGASVTSLGVFSYHEAKAQQEPAYKESGNDSASPPSAAAEGATKDLITVRGRVLDPEGKPLAEAKLYLGHFGSKDEVAVTEKAKSDAAGCFEFRFPKSQLSKVHPDRRIGAMYFEPQPRDEADPFFTPVGQVLAVGEGYGGFDWARIDPAKASTELNLRLVKDVPINGRILDQDGKRVAGARLYLSRVQAYPDEKLEAALAEFRKSNAFPGGEKRWGGPLPGQARAVTTGPDGRFRMAGLGGERYVTLHIEGPGIASTNFQVITRPGDVVVGPDKIKGHQLTPPIPGGAQGADTREEMIDVTPIKVHGATFRYLAAASRPIRGAITDKVTGKPLAGVMIRVAPKSWEVMATTHTDGEGRYELLGCPKSPTYLISAHPSDTGRYFGVALSETDAPGIGPMTVDIQLPQGIPIRGKVLDERTGKPIAGASVRYFCLDPNPAEAIVWSDYPAGSAAITGLDGSFAVAVLPGPGVLAASACESTSGGRSRPYLPGKVTVKEWDAFVAKYKVPPPQFPPIKKWDDAEKCEVLEYASQIEGHSYAPLRLGHFNSLALLHPDEKKDKELKRDLKLRPDDGEQKSKDKVLNLKGTGGSASPPSMINPKKQGQKP